VFIFSFKHKYTDTKYFPGYNSKESSNAMLKIPMNIFQTTFTNKDSSPCHVMPHRNVCLTTWKEHQNVRSEQLCALMFYHPAQYTIVPQEN